MSAQGNLILHFPSNDLGSCLLLAKYFSFLPADLRLWSFTILISKYC